MARRLLARRPGKSIVERAVFAGLSVLGDGLPCAVGISAPLSIVRGAGQAAERGILMRTGEAFQGFRLVKQIVLDKTGTLTEGRPGGARDRNRSMSARQELLALPLPPKHRPSTRSPKRL